MGSTISSKRRAKIVATLGTSTSDYASIETLARAGVDLFRMNFSHGSQQDHQHRIEIVRQVETDLGHPIGILVDLQGPKLRVGSFPNGPVLLEKGQQFRLTLQEVDGDATQVTLPHPEIFVAVSAQMNLLVNDGAIQLQVNKVEQDVIYTTVTAGGLISDRKGVNVPDVVLPIAILTEKDRNDLEFALDLGIDWCAISFVQSPEDLRIAKELIAGRAGVMAKLEKPQALDHLEEIVELADAIMVARGDLGVEVPPERVPSLQRRIVASCRAQGKPVVVATQMLESMISSSIPTRAEASDVATAIYSGVDAVMLSAETAIGDYPLESVAVMERIIRYTEEDEHYRRLRESESQPTENSDNDAIAAAACNVAHSRNCSAVVTFTTTGSTTLRAARMRPPVQLLALTPSLQTARKLQLVWGVHGIYTADVSSFEEMIENSTQIARQQGLVSAGGRMVVTAGVPFGTPGATNILRLVEVR
ncbi:pyruvate kinase [Pseudomonadota bacterium]